MPATPKPQTPLLTKLKQLYARIPKEHGHMWRNFFWAVGLLGFAMLAALYSSNATRRGDVLEASISATLALGVSIWVGIRQVPRLARGVDWNWLPFLTQYRMTREGWIYLGAIVVVVFAAINTNNNLLYMVLSALLSVLILSGLLSTANFSQLRPAIRFPLHAYATEPFSFALSVENPKFLFPSFSLFVEMARQSSIRFRPVYFPLIRTRGRSVATLEAHFPRRGRYTADRVAIRSRYPFGFFSKGREYPVEGECVCYPEIVAMDRLDLAILDLLGTNQRLERGHGYDLYTVRDYVPSDSARHVHWKASAKSATLKTREFAAEETRKVVILFDRHMTAADRDRFEHLVSEAASYVFHLMRAGIDVALVSDDWNSGAHGSTETHQDAILRYLALVEGVSNPVVPRNDSAGGAIMMSLRHERTEGRVGI